MPDPSRLSPSLFIACVGFSLLDGATRIQVGEPFSLSELPMATFTAVSRTALVIPLDPQSPIKANCTPPLSLYASLFVACLRQDLLYSTLALNSLRSRDPPAFPSQVLTLQKCTNCLWCYTVIGSNPGLCTLDTHSTN